LYESHVPRPSVWKERLLAGLPPLLRLLRPSFHFRQSRYRYFYHPYNRTVRNERCVEIPIALAWMRRFQGARILEVGHVLGHYGVAGHDVVDKYERSGGVIAADIVEFTPATPYDLIVSISTLEHVGWDEVPKEPEKLRHALAHLERHCLVQGGTLLATFPLGYNAFLDAALRQGTLPFSHASYLRRLSKWAHWEECTATAAEGTRYGAPYPGANALAVCVLTRSTPD